MVSNDVYLPSFEDLEVEEVPLSTPYLRAGAQHLGKYCENFNNEFMLCRKETQDIRECLPYGKAVTSCSLEFFRKVKASCFHEFTKHAECLDLSSGDLQHAPCRQTQAVMDLCLKKNLGLDRPEFGYHSRVKVHHTDRPRPEPVAPQVFEDTPKDPPAIEAKGRAKYGTRFYWIE